MIERYSIQYLVELFDGELSWAFPSHFIQSPLVQTTRRRDLKRQLPDQRTIIAYRVWDNKYNEEAALFKTLKAAQDFIHGNSLPS